MKLPITLSITACLLSAAGCDKNESTKSAQPEAASKPAEPAKSAHRQKADAAPPAPKPAPKPAKKINDPADLPPKLAKLHEATTGLPHFGAGEWDKFHAATIEKHGPPTFTKELYGKPAYYWAAREGDVCVQFGHPEPKDKKTAKTWTAWQPSIVQPPDPALKHGNKMSAERRWKECISYAEGKSPE